MPKPGQPYWSPRKMRLRNRPYCTQNGWSSPKDSRTSAMRRSLGARPAKRIAGSTGGMTKKMTKVKKVTRMTTSPTHSSRRAMYLAIWRRPPVSVPGGCGGCRGSLRIGGAAPGTALVR